MFLGVDYEGIRKGEGGWTRRSRGGEIPNGANGENGNWERLRKVFVREKEMKP